MVQRVVGSASYLAVVRGLLDMYFLTRMGKFESAEADALRDTMDEPWTKLTEEERAKAFELSELLNAIGAAAPGAELQPVSPSTKH